MIGHDWTILDQFSPLKEAKALMNNQQVGPSGKTNGTHMSIDHALHLDVGF